MPDHVDEPAPTPPLEAGLAEDAVGKTFQALMEAEPEVTNGFLLAGVYARAIRTGSDPRTVADSLFKALPDSETWPAVKAAFEGLLEGD